MFDLVDTFSPLTKKMAVQDALDKVDSYIEGLDKKVNEEVGAGLGSALADAFNTLVTYLNYNSLDIISITVLAMGLLTMVAPVWGGNAGTWIGRLVFTCTAGVIWRLLIP